MTRDNEHFQPLIDCAGSDVVVTSDGLRFPRGFGHVQRVALRMHAGDHDALERLLALAAEHEALCAEVRRLA